MIKSSKATRLAALLLAASLLLPVIQANAAEPTAASINDTYDTYFTDVYDQLNGTNHVYTTLTYHELDYMLDSEGTYVILFGGAWDPATQAVIGYINEVAKEHGVKAIHNFDTRLDGKFIDIADSSFSPYSRRYVELVNKYLTNIEAHAQGTDQVTFSDTVTSGRAPNQVTRTFEGTAKKIETPFLFVYNKDHKNGGDSAPIISSLEHLDALLTNGTVDVSKADAYKEQVKAVFEAIPGEEDVLQNNDYITSSYNEFAGTTIFDESDRDIVIDPVTYDELTHILESEGSYVFMFGCSWCPNTRAIAKLVNQYAKAYGIDTVYNWDTKLDGGIGGTPSVEAGTDSANFLQTRTTGHPYANVYVDLVNKYFSNIETLYDKESNNVSYTDSTGTEIVVNKLQVPYVFVYNKDHKDVDGKSAPIIGHVELMYTWTNIQQDYERDGKVGVNYNNYTAALDDLFSTLAGSLPQAAPTGITGTAPTSAISNDGNILGTSTALEYKRAEATEYVPVTDSSITDLAQGSYYLRTAAKDGYKASPAVIIDLNLEQAAPTGLSGTAPTTLANEDGKITGASAVLEYKLAGEERYTAAVDQTIEGLAAGTYHVRTAAKYGYNASQAIDVIVPGYVPVTFADVPPTAWHHQAISYLADKEIVTGAEANSFNPDAKITTGQLADWLHQAYGVELAVKGTDSPISRQDLFTQIHLALNVIGKLPEANTNIVISSYSDSGQIAGYAQDALQSLVQSGIIQGHNGKLRPTDAITRAEAAQVLYNLLVQ